MKKILIFLGLILSIGLTLLIVQAQSTIVTVSPRCNSNGIIDIDYAYKIYSTEGYTNYIAILTAGRCERQFRGSINRTTNIQTSIVNDVRLQITNRAIALYPDPFSDLDVDGRGYFTIP